MEIALPGHFAAQPSDAALPFRSNQQTQRLPEAEAAYREALTGSAIIIPANSFLHPLAIRLGHRIFRAGPMFHNRHLFQATGRFQAEQSTATCQ